MASPGDVALARAWLLKFTPVQPVFVPPVVFAKMKAEPEIADLMDRVAVAKPLPSEEF